MYIYKIIKDVDGEFHPLIEFSIQSRNFRSTLRIIRNLQIAQNFLQKSSDKF